MISQNHMPKFKKRDLVRNTVILSIPYPLSTRALSTLQNLHEYSTFILESIPTNKFPLNEYHIKLGVVFEVDAVFPWDVSNESNAKRYRLILNPQYLERVDDLDRQISEGELLDLHALLADGDMSISFYAFANEHELELVEAFDGRLPGNPVLEAWTADEYFPWNIRLQFPNADQLLCYDIQAWLYDDVDENDEELGFWIWLKPLYVSEPSLENILSLQVKPSSVFEYDVPFIDFYSERKALCQTDIAEREINVVIQFHLVVDLEQHTWWFNNDRPYDVTHQED